MRKLALLTAMAALVAGCSTVELSSPKSLEGVKFTSADDRGGRALVVAGEGYYLFQSWPLVSSDINWDDEKNDAKIGVSFFRHELSADNFIRMMEKFADRENCDVVDICVENKWTAPFGLFGIADWFSTIIGYHRMNYSATLVPRK